MQKNDEDDLREIRVIGSECESSSMFPGNTLRLSKYTLLSIVPKNLFEQFQRTSNIWFLMVSIFQLIPFELNPTDAWNTILPLSILLFGTLIKDAYQDHLLKKQDDLINQLEYKCWNGSQFIVKKCKDILVGDIVIINDSQLVPADVLLLDCTGEKKIVYSNMTRLTGSTLFKSIKAVDRYNKMIFTSENEIKVNSKLNGIIKISEPNLDYTNFYGRLKLVGEPSGLELKIDNLLFKGSVLQGVDRAVCFALYCGSDCKIQMNSKKISHKTSKLEKTVNKWVLYILSALGVFVLFSVIGFYFFNHYTTSDYSVIEPIITFTLLYNNIIPISLFMVIDIIRLSQSYIIPKLMSGIKFNTERINENLGQCEFILADKTGTITEGALKVKALIIDDQIFFARDEDKLEIQNIRCDTDEISSKQKEGKSEGYNFEDLKAALEEPDYENTTSKEFVKCLALCHSLNQQRKNFLGSQDEIALVTTAASLDFELAEVTKNKYFLKIQSELHCFEIIASRPFVSELKKSRILLRQTTENFGLLYVKGDSSVILQLLDKSKIQKEEIRYFCEEMNEKGFRTMVLGYKVIPLQEIEEIKSKVTKIQQSLLNYEGRIETVFREIEKNLTYLGITCIEEEVTKETINTISMLTKAKIKIWMLSGDSYGNTNLTAKFSGLIDETSQILQLKSISDEFTCAKTLKEYLSLYVFNEGRSNRLNGEYPVNINNNFQDVLNYVPYKDQGPGSILRQLNGIELEDFNLNREFDPSHLNYCVFIDRKTFLTAMSNEMCRQLIVPFFICAKTVCFSMLMPSDKGDIAKLLKNNVKFKPLVLSIGDGEGDISMLQASDVGVSVKTHLNSMLYNFSDISITNFSDLEELLLTFGHWNYSRLSRAIYLFLYKNFFLTMMLLAYTFQCAYSGTSLFNASLLVGYNIVFTTLPVLVIGVYDEDISKKQIYMHPTVYVEGLEGRLFYWKKLLLYLFLGLFQGAFLCLLIFFGVPYIITTNGQTIDLDLLGTMIYVSLIITVLVQIYLDTYCYNLLYYVSQVLSLVFLFIFIIIQNYVGFTDQELVGVGNELVLSPFSFFTIFCTSIICAMPIYGFYTYKAIFYPNIIERLKSNTCELLDFNRLEKYKKSLASIYKSSSGWKNSSKDGKFSMNKHTLKFNLPYVEKDFKSSFINENLIFIKGTVIGVWILVILWTILSSSLLSVSFDYLLSRVIISALFGVIVYLVFTDHFKKYFDRYILFIVFLTLLTKFVLEISFSTLSILATALVPSVTFILLNTDWLYMIGLNILNITLLIIILPLIFNNESSTSIVIILGYLVLTISITFTSAIVGYYLEISKRTEYKLLNVANARVERTQSILSLLLPPFVKNRVKEGIRYIADNQGEVTILFCDISDFEAICKDYQPRELRVFLDSLFKIFDSLCENTGVTKIETVGKTYMACAGLHDSDLELPQSHQHVPHARRVIELALAMIQEVSTIRLTNGNWLQVKIGVNTGTVVAGVVGYHKPQFSLVGDTVNTASRMCSTLSDYNSIQISQSTFEYLKNYNDLHFEENKVLAKGKGMLTTFVVKEKKNDRIYEINEAHTGSLQTSARFSISTEPGTNRMAHFDTYRDLLESKLTRTNTVLISNTSIFQNKCNENEREREFRHSRLDTNYRMILLSLVIALIAYCLNLILSICEYLFLENYSNLQILTGRGFVLVCLALIIFLHHRIYKHLFYPFIIFCVLTLMLIISLFNLIYNTSILADYTALEIMYIIVILSHSSGASLVLVFIANVCVFVPWVILALTMNSTQSAINITNIILVAAFSFINYSSIFIQSKKHRKNYNLNTLANKEIKETEKLLVQMMPAHVLEGLRNDKSDTDRLENVTILYADIVGFTNWSSNKSPEEVVKMLSQFFSRFDKKCVEFDVYKVHTIGDCYVVLGFSGKSSRDPAKECFNVIKMAKSMLEIIEDENVINKSDLAMRIGIHTGEVIAGVIGTNTVRYDIWGPDVLIANKMESSGKQGFINVSASTREMLQQHFCNYFEFAFNKQVNISALDQKINTFFLGTTDFNVIIQ